MSIASTADELAPRTARRPILVVSNREPYLHAYAEDGSISWAPTTGGVAVALDALMRERGGVWVAHGAGSADRAVVDADDRLMVPPDNPTYPLRRIWLSAEEETHYYAGFANEGLWPLCHEAHVRQRQQRIGHRAERGWDGARRPRTQREDGVRLLGVELQVLRHREGVAPQEHPGQGA